MIARLGALMTDPLCVLTQQYFDTTNVVMKRLSRSSAGTLYHQILLGLTEQIESGEIGVGDRLPSEADLVSDFRVSRTTARRALDELRRQGLVRREPGRGTFLVSPRLRSNLAYLHSFTEEIERWGYTPGARLVSQEKRAADEDVAARLEIGVGEKVLFVRRLRLADERPIFVCDSHLPVGRFPALKDADYGTISLSRLFEESTGVRSNTPGSGSGPRPQHLTWLPCSRYLPGFLCRKYVVSPSSRATPPSRSSRRTSTPSATSTTTNSPPGP